MPRQYSWGVRTPIAGLGRRNGASVLKEKCAGIDAYSEDAAEPVQFIVDQMPERDIIKKAAAGTH
jgi:hypothetical protein